MQALKTRIIVQEPLEKENEVDSATGFYIPQKKTDFKTPVHNEVISVGSEVKYVKPHDQIYYMPTTGYTLEEENRKLRFICEDDVLAII